MFGTKTTATGGWLRKRTNNQSSDIHSLSQQDENCRFRHNLQCLERTDEDPVLPDPPDLELPLGSCKSSKVSSPAPLAPFSNASDTHKKSSLFCHSQYPSRQPHSPKSSFKPNYHRQANESLQHPVNNHRNTRGDSRRGLFSSQFLKYHSDSNGKENVFLTHNKRCSPTMLLLRNVIRRRISFGDKCKRFDIFFVCTIFSTIVISARNFYLASLPPKIEYDPEWTDWELMMQQSVADLIPPLPESHQLNSTQSTFLTDIFENLHGLINGVDNVAMSGGPISEQTMFPNSDHLNMFPELQKLQQQIKLQRMSGNIQSKQAKSSFGIKTFRQTRNRRPHVKMKGQVPFAKHDKHFLTVPLPNYELIGKVRSILADNLRYHAKKTCTATLEEADGVQMENSTLHEQRSLPVLGITVATDTPSDRYLRRLLHTIDLSTVGSIVITWYDEQTVAQLLGDDEVGLSHIVIEQALVEFIERVKFEEVFWQEKNSSNTSEKLKTTTYEGDGFQLASQSSLRLMSQISSSMRQFCRIDGNASYVGHRNLQHHTQCQNELLIIRFPTNLGCSSGVNNPLFTHPTSPHWLIANYDIAYPPGILYNMGKELKRTIFQRPNLAIHTFGYIYGRGKLENPWSNFIMTSCAVAKVGVWDEDEFPAYYEDDDYRDRIRYIIGKWRTIMKKTNETDLPPHLSQIIMDDSHVIRYQNDRNVSVVHGPLSATGYVSGTHSTMEKWSSRGFFDDMKSYLGLFLGNKRSIEKNRHRYESDRWSVVRELSDAPGYFRCKHGSLPDPGVDGRDSLRYFGFDERFELPFENVTRLNNTTTTDAQVRHASTKTERQYNETRAKLWSEWRFNATRRFCIHNGANEVLSSVISRDEIIAKFQRLCSVC
ncbi:hypothetical protein ACHAXS_007985 [Conticribra weissflogii]